MSTGTDRSSSTPTNGRSSDGKKIDLDITEEKMEEIIETFETTTTPMEDLARECGVSREQFRVALDRPLPMGENNRDRVTVPPDETVLKPQTGGGDIYHLPAVDRWGTLCHNGGAKPNYKEKPLSVLPGYELCNRCAARVLARTEAITPTEVTVDG